MPAPQTEVLITVDGVERGRYLFEPGEYILGRAPECHVCIEADQVSRRHAKLTLNFDHAIIEDIGSSNGTKINGRRVTDGTRLWPNQKIQLGAATVELRRRKTDSVPATSLAPAQQVLRSMLPPEILLAKKYDIGGVVARGGMGTILDAREAAIKRKVAMKVMLDSNNSEDIARFVAEAQITGQLEHPNIVPVHELGVDENDQPFYTMKMVRGITLQKVLELMAEGADATAKKYPLAALLTIFQKVCDAMAFAHSKGVIHRDLKPENIMLGDYGEALVMDWGLAKQIVDCQSPIADSLPRTAGVADQSTIGDRQLAMTLQGSILGTPQYMAPEQARGEVETMDERADIYALGAILYHILALQPAVTGDNPMAIVGKVARGEIAPLVGVGRVSPRAEGSPTGGDRGGGGELRGSVDGREPRPTTHLPGGRIPDSLAAVCRKAMALDPAARYESVPALQADIEAFQNGFATSAEQAGAWKQAGLFIRRHKAASLGVAAVLLIGGVLGTRAVIEGQRAERGEARANAALADLKKTAPSLRQLAASEAGFQRFESALQKLDAALALDPGNLDAYWQRAWILIGLEHWSEASAALRLAAEIDSANAGRAEIVPTLLELAGAPEPGRWTSQRALELTRYLEKVSANGSLAALSAKLRLNAESRRKLVETRVKEWLGPSAGNRVQIQGPGLIRIALGSSGIDSLEPLHGLPIDQIDAGATNVSNLEPLRGMKLSFLIIGGTKVTSLDPLRGMKLTQLSINNTKVSDLSPLAGAPLRDLDVTGSSVHDLSPIHGAPLEVFHGWNVQIVDFSPLSGAPLKVFAVGNTDAGNLSYLAKAPIEEIIVGGGHIDDLSPLRGKPVRLLQLNGNRVRDLSPLRGAPITDFMIIGNPVQDYSPLLDLKKLEKIAISGDTSKLAVLRNHPTLRFISHNNGVYLSVAEFWKEYDAQHAAGKK